VISIDVPRARAAGSAPPPPAGRGRSRRLIRWDFGAAKSIMIAQLDKGRMSPERHEFARNVVLAGGEYHVARSIDDVQHMPIIASSFSGDVQ
jgi:hypothetical protein